MKKYAFIIPVVPMGLVLSISLSVIQAASLKSEFQSEPAIMAYRDTLIGSLNNGEFQLDASCFEAAQAAITDYANFLINSLQNPSMISQLSDEAMSRVADSKIDRAQSDRNTCHAGIVSLINYFKEQTVSTNNNNEFGGTGDRAPLNTEQEFS